MTLSMYVAWKGVLPWLFDSLCRHSHDPPRVGVHMDCRLTKPHNDILLADPPLRNMHRKPCRLPVLFSGAPCNSTPPLLLPSGCGIVMALRGIPSGETLTLCHLIGGPATP